MIKFLFDQNISYRILKKLPEQFKDSSHVKPEGLINVPDQHIWEFAKQKGFIIVTQDSDFNDLSSLHGFPPKIIWIRTGNSRTSDIVEILLQYSREIAEFVNHEEYGCFEITRFIR